MNKKLVFAFVLAFSLLLVIITGVSLDGAGKVVCIKSDDYLGTCTNQPNSSGVCTCA